MSRVIVCCTGSGLSRAEFDPGGGALVAQPQAHAARIGRALGPLSPPAMSQSMPVRSTCPAAARR